MYERSYLIKYWVGVWLSSGEWWLFQWLISTICHFTWFFFFFWGTLYLIFVLVKTLRDSLIDVLQALLILGDKFGQHTHPYFFWPFVVSHKRWRFFCDRGCRCFFKGSYFHRFIEEGIMESTGPSHYFVFLFFSYFLRFLSYFLVSSMICHNLFWWEVFVINGIRLYKSTQIWLI